MEKRAAIDESKSEKPKKKGVGKIAIIVVAICALCVIATISLLYVIGLDKEHLTWSDRSSNEMDWNSAKEYCENLTEGGYSDWRLPDIDELRTLLIADRVSNRCRVSERNNCLSSDCWSCSTCTQTGSQESYGEVCSNWGTKYSDGRYSRLGDGEIMLWSSSTMLDSPKLVWGVSFGSGNVNFFIPGYHYVRCVR